MSANGLSCDQVIFTSVRSPMGEGYRVIAASKGVKSEEKQAITRLSPSHEGLCASEDDIPDSEQDAGAVAFYALPGGRLCAALTVFAGAEHTGRGGQRVYTHNLILESRDFETCGFNPFNLFRAMRRAELNRPQLKPQPVLDSLTLILAQTAHAAAARLSDPLRTAVRCHVLNKLLTGGRLVLNMPAGWLESAEALLLGLPGPLRAKVSFAAGMKFSVGRTHNMHVLSDVKNVARTRTTGQPIEFIDTTAFSAAVSKPSAWVSFVERHWAANSLASLAARTNRAYSDITTAALERIAKLYDTIDNVAGEPTDALLSRALEQLQRKAEGAEGAVVEELLAAEGAQLRERLAHGGWSEARRTLQVLGNIRRTAPQGRAFARPLVVAAFRSAAGEQLLEACEATVEALRMERTRGGDDSDECACLDEVAERLAAHLERGETADAVRLRRLCDNLKRLRAQTPALARLQASGAPATV